MREATSGDGFNVILRDEFEKLDHVAQLAYVICSLAMARGAPGVYRKHLLACLDLPGLKGATLLREELKGVVVPVDADENLLKARHRLISQLVSNELASDDIKIEATVTFLQTISADIVPDEIMRKTPTYLAYRGMINCDGLLETFHGDAGQVIKIYEKLKSFYQHDFLFLLQHAMAHIRAGQLDVGENYLNQSLALRPTGNFQAENQKGILHLMRAAAASQPKIAMEEALNGLKLLKDQIVARGSIDSHPYGAYLTYVARWYQKAGELISQAEWEALRQIAADAKRKYPEDEVIQKASEEVTRLYMMRAVKDKR
jgi:hypothetical protein